MPSSKYLFFYLSLIHSSSQFKYPLSLGSFSISLFYTLPLDLFPKCQLLFSHSSNRKSSTVLHILTHHVKTVNLLLKAVNMVQFKKFCILGATEFSKIILDWKFKVQDSSIS